MDWITYLKKGHSKIYFIGPTYAPNFFTNLALEVRRESFIKYMKEKKMYSDSLLLECERSSESAEQEASSENVESTDKGMNSVIWILVVVIIIGIAVVIWLLKKKGKNSES